MAKPEQNKEAAKEVKASARYIHVSPRKLRLVADVVRKGNVADALEQLRYSSKTAALPITKLLNSAIANAEHNFQLKKENLFIKALTVDGGPVYKRMVPRAQGRGFVVRKRTSHINITLESRNQSKKRSRRSIFSLRSKKAAGEPEETHEHEKETESGSVKTQKGKPVAGPKSEQKIKENRVSLKRRLFNRKGGE
ncbi:MAG: 50S ribosomal protein L22 [Acidobacteriaceae bacterium]